MTARPMTEVEREEAEEAARNFLAVVNPNSKAALVARALLSSSSAERGMREALETINNSFEKYKRLGAYQWINSPEAAEAFDLMRAALSLEGEDEQARPSGSAPISTDTKGTTK